jgi:hypothetical protein
MENQQPIIYNLNDLIDFYLQGKLPEGEKIFKYEASFGLHKWIHLDELRIQANFKAYYSTDHKYIEGFRGIVNDHHQPKKKEDDKTV